MKHGEKMNSRSPLRAKRYPIRFLLVSALAFVAAFAGSSRAEEAAHEAQASAPSAGEVGVGIVCPDYRGRHYEIHYGFIEELFRTGSEEPVDVKVTLTPSYRGRKCLGRFCAAIHLTSELLWEADDPNSTLSSRSCMSPGGSYHTSVNWQTRTGTGGDPWDGLSFVFGYPPTDPDGAKLRIDVQVLRSGTEIYRWTKTYTAKQLETNFPQIYESAGPNPPLRIPATPEGHEIEFGAHFSLAYRVYDFLLFWGYGTFTHDEGDHIQTCANPAWPLAVNPLENWTGRLSLAGGLIHPVEVRYMKSGEDRVTDCSGNSVSLGQLVTDLCFESFVEEKVVRTYNFEDSHAIENGNAKAISVNLVVPTAVFNGPKESWPLFSVHVAAEGRTLIDSALPVEPNRDPVTEESLGGSYTLPSRWQSIDAVFRCADTKHVVHGHEHWCWFKHEY